MCVLWSERYSKFGLTQGTAARGHHVLQSGSQLTVPLRLGMDALVSVCSRNTNVIMVWAWMHWEVMLSKHERYYGLGMDVLVFVHGCTN